MSDRSSHPAIGPQAAILYFKMALSCARGEGGPQDYKAAAECCRPAAEQGNPSAQYFLGYLYEWGLGVSLDLTAAANWYRKAAKQGHEKARIGLAQLRKKLPADTAPNVKVTSCPVCGTIIANHALKMHLKDCHRSEPKHVSHNQKQPLPTSQGQARLPPLQSTAIKKTQPTVHDQPAIKLQGGHAICPRCGGDGGVRGGCQKCDGTGWVPEMERGRVYRPTQHVSDNSRVSNADYQGGNLGAHFREMDGRFGSIPMHDDYSEESEES